MSIPNAALQKLVQEIETQAIVAQQQINVVKNQVSVKQRDVRMLQLTATELTALPRDARVYEGVGKMFVCSPIPEVEKRLANDTGNSKTDIEKLGKKLQYLETTYKNSREHINQILGGGGRA